MKSIRTRLERLEKTAGGSSFGVFLRKYMDIIGQGMGVLPQGDKTDDEAIGRLCAEYPEEAGKLSEFLDEAERGAT